MKDLLILYYASQNRCTIAIEADGTIHTLPEKPVKWLRRWCVEAGSSLEGRLEGYRKKMGIVQKPALYIGGYPPLIFIPTVSMERDDCLYLRADRIRKITSVDGMAVVCFDTGVVYRLPVCARSLRQQRNRSLQYLEMLSGLR